MASLLRLPTELLLQIHEYLPPDAILALKLSHPLLNEVLPQLRHLQNKMLTTCGRFALERHRALSNGNPSHLRCILCKQIYPADMFTSPSSPACLTTYAPANGILIPEIVDLPSHCCAWHVGRLTRVIRAGPDGKNEWVSEPRRMCMHDGCIDGWRECRCQCDSCGYQMVRTYTRYLNNCVEYNKGFWFFRDTNAGENEDPSERSKGRLFVRERCVSHSGEKSTVLFPVRYLSASSTE